MLATESKLTDDISYKLYFWIWNFVRVVHVYFERESEVNGIARTV